MVRISRHGGSDFHVGGGPRIRWTRDRGTVGSRVSRLPVGHDHSFFIFVRLLVTSRRRRSWWHNTERNRWLGLSVVSPPCFLSYGLSSKNYKPPKNITLRFISRNDKKILILSFIKWFSFSPANLYFIYTLHQIN